MRAMTTILIALVLRMTLASEATAAESASRVLILCYHDVPAVVRNDPHGVATSRFVDQIEYMRAQGVRFVSAADIEAARASGKPLPPKAVLLTFDDAFATFATNVLPILDLYRIPAVLAICTAWIDRGPPEDIPAPLMDWDTLRKVAAHPLVTVASHSHDLHHAVLCNPQSNTAHAATTRMYFPETGVYETDEAYRARLRADLVKVREVFQRQLNTVPDIQVWPYGEYSEVALELAQEAGFRMAFGLGNRMARLDRPMAMDRWILTGNPDEKDFAEDFRLHMERGGLPRSPMRAIRVSLDPVFDPDPERQEEKLGRFLDRMVVLRPSTVFLDAFVGGDGPTVETVYFPNRFLPMRSDLLSRVANQLYVRDFEVFIVMPTLGVRMPAKSGSAASVLSPSPFTPDATAFLSGLYKDMAAHLRFHGVRFRDEAGLLEQGGEQADAKRLAERRSELMRAVRRYRPKATFAGPAADGEFGIGSDAAVSDAMARYDFAVVRLAPSRAFPWNRMRRLEWQARRAADIPGGSDRILFELDLRPDRKSGGASARSLVRWTRRLAAAGARNIGYAPDDFSAAQPALDVARMEYSVDAQLFERPAPISPGMGY